MRVELDKKSIFALASDTRLEMLKSLQPMRRTVSQLSEELKIDKSAVHRHLKKMEEGGLVKRFEDHGFVYYGLTWKARDLIVPNENTQVVIVLSSILMLALVVVLFVAAGLMSEGGNDTLRGLMPDFDGAGDEAAADYDPLSGSGSDAWIMPSLVLCIVIVALAVLAFRNLWKPKQKRPGESRGVEASDSEPSED